MKKFILLVVFLLFFLYACAASNETTSQPPTPIFTSTVPSITNTPLFNPTGTPSPTPEALKYFEGAAYTEEMWASAPTLNDSDIQKVKEYFRDPAHQTLKSENLTDKNKMSIIGTDEPKSGLYVALNVTSGETLWPVASYISEDGLRHVVCEIIDTQGNIQIIDITAYNVHGDYDLNFWYEGFVSGKRLYLEFLLTYGNPANEDEMIKNLVSELSAEQRDNIKNKIFPELENVVLVLKDFNAFDDS